jgi:peroxiredoxin
LRAADRGNDELSEKPKRRGWLSWLRDILILLLLLTAFQWWQTRDLAGAPAPPLSGMLTDGRPVDLRDYRGHPVLVHFWAEWCPICRAEEGALEALAEDYPTLTVATQSGDAATVAAYLRRQGLSFPTLVDQSGALARAWGIRGVPSSYVIAPDGKIDAVSIGYTTGVGLRLRLWWAAR